MKRIVIALLGIAAALPAAADAQVRAQPPSATRPEAPVVPPPTTGPALTPSLSPPAPGPLLASPVTSPEAQAIPSPTIPPDGNASATGPEPVAVPSTEPLPEPDPSGECDDGDLDVTGNSADCATANTLQPVQEQSGSGFSWWYVVLGLAAGFLLSRLLRMVRRR